MPFCTVCHTKLNCVCCLSSQKNFKLKECYNKTDIFPFSFIGNVIYIGQYKALNNINGQKFTKMDKN